MDSETDGKKESPQVAKIKATKDAIEDVKVTLAKNIEAMRERGERMDYLQQKADDLRISSRGFSSQASQVRRTMWLNNMKASPQSPYSTDQPRRLSAGVVYSRRTC